MSCAKVRLFNDPGPTGLPDVAPTGVAVTTPSNTVKKKGFSTGGWIMLGLAVTSVGVLISTTKIKRA